MSRRTASDYGHDIMGGTAPYSFVHRQKTGLSDSYTIAESEIGTATDRHLDPAITAISTTLAGTSGVCEIPTSEAWSALWESVEFYVEIDGNTAGTLTVDLEAWELVEGDTGGGEYWHLVTSDTGLGDTDKLTVTGYRGRLFVRVSGITNPDSGATLYLTSRGAQRSRR
jgi:hypothetical protein